MRESDYRKPKSWKVKVAGINGKIVRLVVDRLTDDECGLMVMLFTNKEWGNRCIDGVFEGSLHGAYLVKSNDGASVVLNPDVVLGWTTPRLFKEDLINEQMQTHPEWYCQAGTYNENPEPV